MITIFPEAEAGSKLVSIGKGKRAFALGEEISMKAGFYVIMGLIAWVVVFALLMAPNATMAQGKPANAPKGLIDLNTASEKEIQEIKGVGPAMAKKIIAGRPYRAVSDLAKAGVPAKTIESLKAFVTVGSGPVPAAPGKESAERGPAAGPGAKMISKDSPGKGPVGLIDINAADEKTLETLPGVNLAVAQEIVKGRPYKSIDELARVRGIDQTKLDALRSKVTIGPSAGVGISTPAGEAPAPSGVVPTRETAGPGKSPSGRIAPTPAAPVPGK